MFEKVQEFNLKVVCVPGDRKPGELEPSERDWLINALAEEIGEFADAHNNQDFVGSIDALIDLIYFAMGGLTRLGLRAEVSTEIFNAVHAANMAKASGVKEERDVTHDLDAVKPEGWVSPEETIAGILEKHYGKSVE